MLLVEDNARLSATLVRGFEEQGFAVEVEATGHGALERLSKRGTDALILDLGLPDMDGLDVLVAARNEGLLVPVLILTARDAVDSRVAALDRGADDYLIKPFAFAELVARLRALVRRAAAPRWAPLALGDLRVEVGTPVVYVGSRAVSLSPRAPALRQHVLRRGGDSASRREILAEGVGDDFDPGTNAIEVHIAHLRRKLSGARARIETIRGAGYRLRVAGDDEP